MNNAYQYIPVLQMKNDGILKMVDKKYYSMPLNNWILSPNVRGHDIAEILQKSALNTNQSSSIPMCASLRLRRFLPVSNIFYTVLKTYTIRKNYI